MKVALGTIEVSDRIRRAIRRFYGQPGLATRKEVRDWALGTLDGEIDVLPYGSPCPFCGRDE